MPVMPCKSLHWSEFCGMGGGWRAALVERVFRGIALHMGKSEGNSGAPRTRTRGAGCRGGSIPGFTCRRRTGRGCAAQFRLTPQMGAGDDPGQEAQPLPHRWRLLRRVNRRISIGVGDPPAGPVPVGFVFVVSHLFPPLVAGVNCLPDPAFTVECDEPQHQREPLMGWFTCEPGFMREPPFKVSGATPRW